MIPVKTEEPWGESSVIITCLEIQSRKISANDNPAMGDFLPGVFTSVRSVEEKQTFQFSKPCLRELEQLFKNNTL